MEEKTNEEEKNELQVEEIKKETEQKQENGAKFSRKNIYLAVGFLVVIVVILFGGAFIYNQFFYKKSFSEIEEIMVNASEKYFANHSNKLPQKYNEAITLSDTELVDASLMKSINEYLKDDGISCTGKVIVTNINGKYRYTPSLDCGSQYQTVFFSDYIKKMVPVVESGSGLYQVNDELVYRGDNVNNYLKLGNNTYRIVKFSGDSASVIYTEKAESMAWDDRYNLEKEEMYGINDYSVSRVKEYLTSLYKGDDLLSSSDKMLVVAHNLEIGKRALEDSDKTGGLEKSVVLENQFIGLLPIYDYLNASLDKNCTTTASASCMNYNYLSKYRFSWWSLTASNKNTYQVYRIDANGSASISSGSNNNYVRPVLYLTKEAIYSSGDGTKKNPYILK